MAYFGDHDGERRMQEDEHHEDEVDEGGEVRLMPFWWRCWW